jgi:hypothetical protein
MMMEREPVPALLCGYNREKYDIKNLIFHTKNIHSPSKYNFINSRCLKTKLMVKCLDPKIIISVVNVLHFTGQKFLMCTGYVVLLSL